MSSRSVITVFAAAAALLASGASATATTAPLSAPRIAAHFDLAAAQQPENITVDHDGTAYLTFSFARQVVQVSPAGRIRSRTD